MAIDYINIHNADREIIGIIDTASSIIWHSVYYGVGDFEVYTAATQEMIDYLSIGNFVSRPNDFEIGIIESVDISYDTTQGRMITAKGRFVKSILDRRQIYNLSGSSNTATILYGKVEEEIRRIVSDNAINCTFDPRRNIPILKLGDLSGISDYIIDQYGNRTRKQVSYANLLTYSDDVLAEYSLSATCTLNTDDNMFEYIVFKGEDRSTDNESGNDPVIFSQDFENLSESTYTHDLTPKKTAALIGGEGEGIARFYSMLDGSETGLERRETWIDASSLSKKHKESGEEEEQTYTDEEYKSMLDALGSQKLADMIEIESFVGTIDVTEGQFVLNRDFALGDIVTIQDNDIGIYMNSRIVETLETQDDDGYSVEVVYK